MSVAGWTHDVTEADFDRWSRTFKYCETCGSCIVNGDRIAECVDGRTWHIQCLERHPQCWCKCADECSTDVERETK